MKRRILQLSMAVIALVALLAPPRLEAQSGEYRAIKTFASGGTYVIPASTTTNLASAAVVTRWDEIHLDIQFKLHAAGTSALDFVWDTSSDGTNYQTVAGPGRGTFSIAANGTTAVVHTTNIVVNSLGYWRLNYITNGNAAVVTNLSIKAYGKPRRTGP